ncbi:DMT family transporter [Aliikangiella sp. IMCC44653]
MNPSSYLNSFLYLLTVLIWGSTWLAIEFQLGEVAVEVSLIYRFGLAGILIIAFSRLAGLTLNFSLKQHGYIALLGLFNFCLNYVALYEAQKTISSAITSIGFSLLLLINIINTRLFFGKPISIKTYLGAVVGVVGICVLFWPQVANYQSSPGSAIGIVLILVGTLFASFGNMISVRNSKDNYPVLQTSGLAMLYGTAFLLVFAFFNQSEFTLSSEPSYWWSLAYLSIFGTVIAFYCYFILLKNIGPEKTSYSIVLFPVVAVILSTIYEDFPWTGFTIGGFLLVASGNLIMLTPTQKIINWLNSLRAKQPDVVIKTKVEKVIQDNIAATSKECVD